MTTIDDEVLDAPTRNDHMNGRRVVSAAIAGVIAGVTAEGIWSAADHVSRACAQEDSCISAIPAAIGWFIGPYVVAGVGFVVMLATVGRGSRLRFAVPVAPIAPAFGYFCILTYEWFSFGSPQPPLIALVCVGALSYLGTAMAVIGPRSVRYGTAGIVVVVAMVGAVAAVRSDGADRRHELSVLAPILRLPDLSKYRVISADTFPLYDAVRLTLMPVGGGENLLLFEVPRPATWDPPTSCGPELVALAFAVLTDGKVVDSACSTYAGGGWQRAVPGTSGEFLDVVGSTLAMVSPAHTEVLVPADELRSVLTGLVPATPAAVRCAAALSTT